MSPFTLSFLLAVFSIVFAGFGVYMEWEIHKRRGQTVTALQYTKIFVGGLVLGAVLGTVMGVLLKFLFEAFEKSVL